VERREKRKVVTTIVEKEVPVEIICDGCHKMLDGVNVGRGDGFKNHDEMYYHVTRHHEDWGNDSYESYEYSDYCPKCLHQALDEYMKDLSFTKHMEIECRFPEIKGGLGQ